MHRRFSRKQLAGGLGGVGLAVLGVVAALAFFTSNGTGSGTATVGTPNGNLTVENVSIPSTLFPGGSSPVSFDVKNLSSNSKIKVGQVIADTSGGTNGISFPSTVTGCSAGDFTFSPATLTTELAPGSTVAGTGTLSMADATTNQNGCEGAAPTLSLKVDNSDL